MSRELSRKSPSSLADGLYKLWRKFTQPFSESAIQSGQFWIDGKPIYRKVIDFGALPDSTSKSVAHGLTGIGEVVGLRGVAINTAASAFVGALPMPLTDQSLSMDATNVTILTTADLTAYEQTYVIIEYTLA